MNVAQDTDVISLTFDQSTMLRHWEDHLGVTMPEAPIRLRVVERRMEVGLVRALEAFASCSNVPIITERVK
jgi:hypothetical protein